MEKYRENKEENKKAFVILVIKKIGMVAGSNESIKNIFN